MAGHSKWKQIKRAKGVTDVKRGALFTKLTKEIMQTAKDGGGDPGANFKLRLAIDKARSSNMPMENIDRAIKKGTGVGGPSIDYIEVMYEGYAHGGAAILCQALTDNKTRTVSEVRNVFSKAGCKMADSGSVSFLFDSKGVISIEATKDKADELALIAIDLGADDVKVEEEMVEVYSQPNDLEKVKKALEDHGFKVQNAEIEMVPKAQVPLNADHAERTIKLMDKLEELDDVTRVYTNADFPAEVLEKANSAA